jgi:hypothetical protein
MVSCIYYYKQGQKETWLGEVDDEGCWALLSSIAKWANWENEVDDLREMVGTIEEREKL